MKQLIMLAVLALGINALAQIGGSTEHRLNCASIVNSNSMLGGPEYSLDCSLSGSVHPKYSLMGCSLVTTRAVMNNNETIDILTILKQGLKTAYLQDDTKQIKVKFDKPSLTAKVILPGNQKLFCYIMPPIGGGMSIGN